MANRLMNHRISVPKHHGSSWDLRHRPDHWWHAHGCTSVQIQALETTIHVWNMPKRTFVEIAYVSRSGKHQKVQHLIYLYSETHSFWIVPTKKGSLRISGSHTIWNSTLRRTILGEVVQQKVPAIGWKPVISSLAKHLSHLNSVFLSPEKSDKLLFYLFRGLLYFKIFWRKPPPLAPHLFLLLVWHGGPVWSDQLATVRWSNAYLRRIIGM